MSMTGILRARHQMFGHDQRVARPVVEDGRRRELREHAAAGTLQRGARRAFAVHRRHDPRALIRRHHRGSGWTLAIDRRDDPAAAASSASSSSALGRLPGCRAGGACWSWSCSVV